MMDRGLLIAFEGGDGSGKSTQAALLAERLGGLLTRQAGGTELGKRIRSLTLDPTLSKMSDRAEALLYMADRAEHVNALVRPALDSGRHVVSDRWAYSTLVYQGYGRGLDVQQLWDIADWATGGLWPDMVLYLDVPLALGIERVHRAGEPDRYEALGSELQQRVVDGYKQIASDDPNRWRIVDAAGEVDEVANRVWSNVEGLVNN